MKHISFKTRSALTLVSLWLAAMPLAFAQLTVDIKGSGNNQYPISVVDFVNSQGITISNIIRTDLENSGVFKLIDHKNMALSESAAIDLGFWQQQGANHIAVGSVSSSGTDQIVRYRLLDTLMQGQADGAEITVNNNERRLAHQVADRIYETVTGYKGVFSTKIAYVLKKGQTHELQIADADGFNPQVALRSPEPIISPSWSPDGSKLAYVSFELRKPVIYVHALASGKRTLVANFKGNNSAPAWSPDGKQLAVVLSRDGGSQIYLINADGSGEPRRLTNSRSIDTEPTFSPNGQFIYFTSDRGGSPQIYRVNLQSNQTQRVTYEGSYNISPNLSNDGSLLTYVTRQGAGFQIALLDLTKNSPALIISEGGNNFSPSFAPNGRQVLYATQTNGKDALAVANTDGLFRRTMTSISGAIQQPKWGPFISN